MPIKVHANIHHLNQNEFGQIAYDVMDHIFAVHNKMGRFLDEDIYRDAVATRVGGDSQTLRAGVAYWRSVKLAGFAQVLVRQSFTTCPSEFMNHPG